MASSGARTQPPRAALATTGVKLSTGGSLCCCSPFPITRAGLLLWEVLDSFLQGFSTSPALVDSLAGVNWASRWCWLGLSRS